MAKSQVCDLAIFQSSEKDHLEHEVLGNFKFRVQLEGRTLETYMTYGKCQEGSGWLSGCKG